MGADSANTTPPAAFLLQRDIVLGRRLKCWLASGEMVTGQVVELGLGHFVIDLPNGQLTVFLDAVAAYQVLTQPENAPQSHGHEQDHSNGTGRTAVLLRQIEQRVLATAARTKIAPRPVDFALDQNLFKDPQAALAAKAWQQARDKYSYAVRVNELDPRFGRLTQVAELLQTVHKQYPHITEVTRHLAYVYWCSGREGRQRAVEIYRELTRQIPAPASWFDRAAVALAMNNASEVCSSLEQFFLAITDTTSSAQASDNLLNAWYAYLLCAARLPDHRPSVGFCRIPPRLPAQFSRDWIEGAIYMLLTHGQKEAAAEVADKWYPWGDGASDSHDVMSLYTAVDQAWEVVANCLGKTSAGLLTQSCSPAGSEVPPAPPAPPTPPAVRVSQLESSEPSQWLHARGCHVYDSFRMDDSEPHWNELASFLGDEYPKIRMLYRAVRELVTTGGNTELDTTSWDGESITRSRKLCRQLRKLGYLSEANYDYRHNRFRLRVAANPNSAGNFLLGGWFERYVYLKLSSLLNENKWPGGCISNAKIILPTGLECELDVFAVIKGKPVWIECKTSGLYEHLLKYATTRKQLGVDRELAFGVELDLPEERCNQLTATFGMTVVNQYLLFPKLEAALA